MKKLLCIRGMRIIFPILISLFSFQIQAQVQTAKYVTTILNSNGYYEYLPQGYSSGSGTYPLIIFLHGTGEAGNGSSSQLPKMLNQGLPKLINQGNFPVSFTVGGQSFKFIVISPQFVSWPTPADVDGILTYVLQHYRVDTKRIYMTGLSMGGGVTWNYAGDPTLVGKLAAIVPIAGASYPISQRANVIADANLPVWATHNDGDPTVPVDYTINYIALILQRNPKAPVKKTIFHANAHDAWTATYTPTFQENGMNIYQWMLQYQKGTTANQPPVVNAGADAALTLPSNSYQLKATASDAGGSISKYSWTKTAGPTTFTISNTAILNPLISTLIAGTYTFRLTVTDNLGATAFDDINITVSAANTPPTVNAGADAVLTLPGNSYQLKATASDVGGSISKYSWTKTAGPTTFTISNTAILNPLISNLIAGTYTFRLTVTDNLGATAFDDINITVNSASNQAPKANAGVDYTITLPTNSVTLTGSGSDADGTIASYLWSKASGPSQGTISTATQATTAITGLAQGVYAFVLKVTDNKGATGTDTAKVTVNASGSSSSPKYVRVNIYGGVNPYSSSQWNNWNVQTASGTSASINVISAKFTYDDGSSSNISTALSHSQAVKDNGATYGSGMAPAQVLRYTSYSSITRTLTISGLSTTKYYDIELYSSRSSSGNPTVFSIGSSSQTINTYDDYTTKASFTNQVPNAQGQLVVLINKTNTFDYINGFMITEKSGTSSTAEETQTDLGSQTEELSVNSAPALTISPNPVTDKILLQMNNPERGTMIVRILNMSGQVQKEYRSIKDQDQIVQTYYLGRMAPGTYIVQVRVGDEWNDVRKIVKF